ncbi:hypothetical protein SU69_04535 [Thermosipho melanesiensis]|uniref:PAS fold-4 domain-containing protein n=2 Tax=Thermosipho melanesiensis TaxID=46541 RepID=A6LLE8_THEM4|nr:PAS domain-containing protein [Thermosipho melanesiensis]ABR30749.1 hypothetical protein Tmel_0888 [Thermosipho melanesiensis BI429]APT73872.1 hypothetical protein BW47_04770 [Thermosipho melanesiensis]OOC35814.1 hypothetical protein SU68_04590 [Thermosipho melanesiensis]OOC38316.1 hypothetical protein SU69_04535 [Thermosipho melanesiensis]OOC38777.1 hypothetical protein SU70_04535 [Thermosipho melanesiensis]
MRHLFYLQQFFERLPSPAFIKDNKHKYIWINREWKKTYGLDDRKVIGKTDEKLFNDTTSYKIEETAIKTKKKQEFEKEYDGKYFRVTIMPIRLGDGTYGVAGIELDETKRYFNDVILSTNLKISEIIRELLLSNIESKDFFMELLIEKIHEKIKIGDYALLKNNEILKTYFPEKVCTKAMQKNDIKEFTVSGEKYIVIPLSEYRLVIRSLPNFLKLVNYITPIVLPKIENVLEKMENEAKRKKYYTTLEKLVEAVVSWKKIDIYSFLKKVLKDIVEIIPEAEKGTVWLIKDNKYKCVAEIGYKDAEKLEFPPEKTSYGKKIEKKINKGFIVFEIDNAKELVQTSPLADTFKKYGMFDEKFRPLLGVFKIGNKVVGSISIDNFSGINFSDESKKILELYVKILTNFLEDYEI